MIKYLCLAAGLVSVSSTAAQACSPSQMVMTGEQNYQALKPSSYASWSDPELSIGLIYAKKKRTKKREVSSREGVTKKPFVKIKFKLIQSISENYVPDETDWFPKIDESGKNRELGRVGKARSFAFWDRRDLSSPHVYGYSIGTSCGPMSSRTLLPNQYYLHFKKGDRTIGFEIVSGPDDALVQQFTQIMSGIVGTKIRRAPENYIKEISGYQDFRLKACPTEIEIEALSWSYGDPKDTSNALNLDQHSNYKSDAEDLKLIDFISYQKYVNGHEWKCETGNHYLVLDKVSRNLSSGGIGMYFVHPPQHRYLEVTNGTIDTNDILSHITILPDENNNTLVSVDKVKLWIEQTGG